MTYLNIANKEEWLSQKLEEERNNIAKALGKKGEEKARELQNCANKKKQLRKALDEALESAYNAAKQSFVLMPPYATQKKEGVECLVIEKGKLPNADLEVDLNDYKDNEGKIKDEAKYNEVCTSLYQELGRQQCRTHLPALPLGMRETVVDGQTYYTPYYIEWQGENDDKLANLYITYEKDKTSSCQDQAYDLHNAILMRIMAAFPTGKVRFTFVDTESTSGNNWLISRFGEKNNEAIKMLCGGIHHFSENEAIKKEIKRLKEQIDDRSKLFGISGVTEKCLRQYNQIKQEINKPYEIVVLYEPFVGNNNTAYIKDLCDMVIKNGEKGGIYFVIVQNNATNMLLSDKRSNEFDNIDDTIKERFQHINCFDSNRNLCEYNGDIFTNIAYFHTNELSDPFFSVKIDGNGARKRESSLAEAYFAKFDVAVETAKKTVRDVRRAPIEQWEADKKVYESFNKELVIPIGRSNNEPVNFVLDDAGRAHSFIMGASGSGKSVFLEDLIVSATMRYSPESLQLYLIDFKDGATFKPYAHLPHVRWCVAANDKAIIYTMLKKLADERERRENSKEKNPPHILAIFDEFGEIFNQSIENRSKNDGKDPLQDAITGILEQLARQGRSARIHLVMATQSIGQIKAEALIQESSYNSYAFRCSRSSGIGELFKKDVDVDNILRELGRRDKTAIHTEQDAAPIYVEPYLLPILGEDGTVNDEKRNSIIQKIQKKAEPIVQANPRTNFTSSTYFGATDKNMSVAYNELPVEYPMEFGTSIVDRKCVIGSEIRSTLVYGCNTDDIKSLMTRIMYSIMRAPFDHYKKRQKTYVINAWNEDDVPEMGYLKTLCDEGYAETFNEPGMALRTAYEELQNRKATNQRDGVPIYLHIFDNYDRKSILDSGDSVRNSNLVRINNPIFKNSYNQESEAKPQDGMSYRDAFSEIITNGHTYNICVILYVWDQDSKDSLHNIANKFNYTIYLEGCHNNRRNDSNGVYSINSLNKANGRAILYNKKEDQLFIPFKSPQANNK